MLVRACRVAPSGRGAEGRGTECGLVLPAVLVMLVALALLSTAALTLARFEHAAAEAGAHHARARLAAEYAAGQGIRRWRAGWVDSVPLLGQLPAERLALPSAPAGATADLSWIRGSRRLWIAQGTGQSSLARARATVLLWVLDPHAEAAQRSAVIRVGTQAPSLVQGTIDAGDLHRVPGIAPDHDCSGARIVFDSLAASGVRNRVQREDSAIVAAAGVLSLDSLLARLPDRVGGSGTPGPRVSLGACDVSGGWNWGEPIDSSHVCRGERLTGGSAGSLSVQGGRGQGLLLSPHDVTLHDVDFFGLVVTGGRLRIQGTSRVTGAVQAAGGVALESGASVVGSACWVAWALDVPELKSPHRIADAPEWLGR